MSFGNFTDRNWKIYGEEVVDEFNNTHKGHVSDETKKLILSIFIRWIMTVAAVPKVFDVAKGYYEEKSKNDAILEKVQQDTKEELENIFVNYVNHKKFKVYPASSFSAKTHLANDSDIDFNLGIKEFNQLDDKEKMEFGAHLENHGYSFVEIRTPGMNVHYVWNKWVNVPNPNKPKVEIEVKIRDLDTYEAGIHKIHQYLDNQMKYEYRVSIVYHKMMLKNLDDQRYYDHFKKMYYEWANISAGNNDLMY